MTMIARGKELEETAKFLLDLYPKRSDQGMLIAILVHLVESATKEQHDWSTAGQVWARAKEQAK